MNIYSWIDYAMIGILFFTAASARYLVMTGVYYATVVHLFGKYLRTYKINPEPTPTSLIRHEIFWGILNNLNFAAIGMVGFWLYTNDHLSIFLDFYKYGFLYHVVVIIGLLYIHDTYFYWLHLWMHKGPLRQYFHHGVHHQAINLSPWSAFSVHPVEGFFEVFFRLLIAAFIPLHPLTILAFELLSFALNIIGHSGYEFFPKNFPSHLLTKNSNCATFHFLHHQDGRSNFSLFFNHWDRWMGTMNPNYESFYAQTKERQLLQSMGESKSIVEV